MIPSSQARDRIKLQEFKALSLSGMCLKLGNGKMI